MFRHFFPVATIHSESCSSRSSRILFIRALFCNIFLSPSSWISEVFVWALLAFPWLLPRESIHKLLPRLLLIQVCMVLIPQVSYWIREFFTPVHPIIWPINCSFLRHCTTPSPITIATMNGSLMHVSVGSILPKPAPILSNPDVFHVPQLSLSLLSIRQLHSGFYVLFSSSGCVVPKGILEQGVSLVIYMFCRVCTYL